MAKLIRVGRDNEGFVLGSRAIIGRNEKAQIRIDDQKVSKLHALIFQREREYFLADIGSRNGTIYFSKGNEWEKLESALQSPAFVSWCSLNFSSKYPSLEIKKTFLTFLDFCGEESQCMEQLVQEKASIRKLNEDDEIGIVAHQRSPIPLYRFMFKL